MKKDNNNLYSEVSAQADIEADKPSSRRASPRPQEVAIGTGLPLTRKLNRLQKVSPEFCRITTLTDDVTEFEIPNSFTLVAFTRRRVLEFAKTMPFTEEQLQDILLAVGEAATNAMKYGCSTTPCSVKVRMEKRQDGFHVFVLDDGVNFKLEGWIPLNSETLEETGRGIQCMKAVMDEVIFHPQECGNCVEMIKYTTEK